MKIITCNVNGIRAAARKGFFDWLKTQNANIICLQETKATIDQLNDPVFHPEGYHSYFFSAEKKGYSGVAIYTDKKPLNIIKGLGWSYADDEGRYLQIDFEEFSVVSLYLPSGTSSEERQTVKYDFLDKFELHLQKLRNDTKDYVICGDWNIAHTKIDLKNWRGNQKNSGFLPEERAWMDKLFGPLGYVDAFRLINQEPEQYTWWSHRGQAWDKNVGWRIDYHVITPGLRDRVKAVDIYKGERFSDHAPVIVEYEC